MPKKNIITDLGNYDPVRRRKAEIYFREIKSKVFTDIEIAEGRLSGKCAICGIQLASEVHLRGCKFFDERDEYGDDCGP